MPTHSTDPCRAIRHDTHLAILEISVSIFINDFKTYLNLLWSPNNELYKKMKRVENSIKNLSYLTRYKPTNTQISPVPSSDKVDFEYKRIIENFTLQYMIKYHQII